MKKQNEAYTKHISSNHSLFFLPPNYFKWLLANQHKRNCEKSKTKRMNHIKHFAMKCLAFVWGSKGIICSPIPRLTLPRSQSLLQTQPPFVHIYTVQPTTLMHHIRYFGSLLAWTEYTMSFDTVGIVKSIFLHLRRSFIHSFVSRNHCIPFDLYRRKYDTFLFVCT